MCRDNKCPLKETCYRFKAKPDTYQSYFLESPGKHLKNGKFKCDMYWEIKSNISKKDLEYFKEFLDFFGVDYSGAKIKLTDGGNSCIMNPNTKWKKLLGYSINEVAEIVAKELNKETYWED